MKKSIIGKKYYPSDNSYCVNLTTCSNYPYNNDTSTYLAGTQMGDEVKECTIISEPFKCIIITHSGKEEYTMILVNYKEHTYSVLFYDNNIGK